MLESVWLDELDFCVNEWTLKPTEVGLVSNQRGKEMGESHKSHALDLSVHSSVHPTIANPSPPATSITLSLGSFNEVTTKVSEIKNEMGAGSVFDHNTFKQCHLRCTPPSLFHKKKNSL